MTARHPARNSGDRRGDIESSGSSADVGGNITVSKVRAIAPWLSSGDTSNDQTLAPNATTDTH